MNNETLHVQQGKYDNQVTASVKMDACVWETFSAAKHVFGMV